MYIYLYIDDNTITIKWPQPYIHHPTIKSTQHEIANPNTNISQIAQTIINFINQLEDEQILAPDESHTNLTP
jgi:hypothetical protein